MFYKNFKLLAVIALLIGLNVLQAQEAIPVTGGDINGSGGSVSYTVGQIVYTSNSGVSGSSEENPNSRLQIANGDVYLSDPESGVILKSPNGQCWRLTVNNNGNFLSSPVECP